LVNEIGTFAAYATTDYRIINLEKKKHFGPKMS
jgi:hypothetical protein